MRGLVPLAAACLVASPLAYGNDPKIDCRLLKIDEGVSWVSGYWGYNAPKLVHDGQTYFTLGSWGGDQSTSRGVIYRLDDDVWRRGYEWEGLDYQPGMLLLDSRKRLILIHSRKGRKPAVMRSVEPGNCESFEPLSVPDWMNPAGYLGAGIHDDRIVIGYIGDPDTYSFQYAVLDLNQSAWSGPFMLAPSQRNQQPFTTWLYPIIRPNAGGISMAVSNGRDTSNLKHEIFYLDAPYEMTAPIVPELVDVVIPWTDRICQAASMHVTAEGTTLIAGQYHEGISGNSLSVWRKPSGASDWTRRRISEGQVGAIFQAPSDDSLWLMSTSRSSLKLYGSVDNGENWTESPLASFEEYGLRSTFFLHGLNAASGSEIPDTPTAVFSSGVHPNYQLWFVQYNVPGAVPASASNSGGSE